MYDVTTGTQYFPFRTLAMLSSLFCCIFGSLVTESLFRKGLLPPVSFFKTQGK
jgi:high affinity choline transporter 7